MKIHNTILSLLLCGAINAQYIIELTVLECPAQITNNDIKDCKDLITNEKPDYNWLPVNFNLNQYETNISYRYLAYKKLGQKPKPAITNINIIGMFDSQPSDCSIRMNVPLKDVPKNILPMDESNFAKYVICYELDKNDTPNAGTEVLTDIKFTNNDNPDDGYQICKTNLNNNRPKGLPDPTNNTNPTIDNNNNLNEGMNNGNNFDPNNGMNKGNPFPEFVKRDISKPNPFVKRESDIPFFLEYKKERPVIATTTQSQVSTVQTLTEDSTVSPIITNNQTNHQDAKNSNNNGITKTFVILSVVSISVAISLIIFVTVNRRRRFNEEKEKEELFSNLPWKTSPNNQNNDFSDPIYGASLPQIENALNNSKSRYPETSLNRNIDGNNQQQNTFNRNAGFSTMRSNGFGTMTSNTLSSRGGTMHSMNSVGTMNTLRSGPITPGQQIMPIVNNMNQGIPPNQTYPTPNQTYPTPNQTYPTPNQTYPTPNQTYPTPNQTYPTPNGIGFMNQQNINLPPMTTSNVNMPINNENNFQNNNVPISTSNYTPNYNPNYQPSMPVTNQPNQNFGTMNTQGTMNSHHTGYNTLNSLHSNNTTQNISNYSDDTNSNDINVNNTNTNKSSTAVQNHKQPNNIKKTLYVTNNDENDDTDNESDKSKVSIEDDSKELLGSTKLAAAEEEEKVENQENQGNQGNPVETNSHLIINDNNSLNLPSSLQIDKLDSSLNLTGIEVINSIQDLIDENNNINPKRISKRGSTLNGVDRDSLLNGSDENIKVIAGYDARELDELTLQIGDIITIKAVYSDGWGFGINNSTKEQGVFPIVCLARKPNLTPTE